MIKYLWEGVMTIENAKRIIQYETKAYGSIRVKLAEELERRGITRNRLQKLTGVKYEVIDRYYSGKITRADLDFLAKVCYVLNCRIDDLLEFIPPEQ